MRLTAICLVALAACGGGQHSSGPVSNQSAKADRPIGNDPLAVIPIDSELVFHLDVQKLRASTTWQRVEPKLLEKPGPMLTQLKAECGLDPLAQISVIAGGVRGLNSDQMSGVIVVHGLERGKTMACIDQQRTKSKAPITIDHDVVTVAGGAPGEQASIVFADATTAVVVIGKATPADVDRVLASGVPLKGSPAFGALLTTIRTSDPLWFVVNGNARLFDQAASLGVKPKAISGSVDLATGLAGTLRVRLETADQAQQLATMANGQVGMAKAFFDKLDVTSDKTDFVVDARMTQAQVDQAMQMVSGALGGGSP